MRHRPKKPVAGTGRNYTPATFTRRLRALDAFEGYWSAVRRDAGSGGRLQQRKPRRSLLRSIGARRVARLRSERSFLFHHSDARAARAEYRSHDA